MLSCIENRFRELECLLLRQAIPQATLCSFTHLCILPTMMVWEYPCSLFSSQWEWSPRFKLCLCIWACMVPMWHECLLPQMHGLHSMTMWIGRHLAGQPIRGQRFGFMPGKLRFSGLNVVDQRLFFNNTKRHCFVRQDALHAIRLFLWPANPGKRAKGRRGICEQTSSVQWAGL